MRIVLVSLGLAAVLGCAAPPPAPAPPAPTSLTDADKAVILEQHEKAAALAKGPQPDWRAFVDAYYAPDAVVLQPNGQDVVGRDAIVAWFSEGPPISVWKGEVIAIVGGGDHAVIHETYELVMNPPDAEPMRDVGRSLIVKHKQADGRWLTTHDMFASFGPAPTEGTPAEGAPAEGAPAEAPPAEAAPSE